MNMTTTYGTISFAPGMHVQCRTTDRVGIISSIVNYGTFLTVYVDWADGSRTDAHPRTFRTLTHNPAPCCGIDNPNNDTLNMEGW